MNDRGTNWKNFFNENGWFFANRLAAPKDHLIVISLKTAGSLPVHIYPKELEKHDGATKVESYGAFLKIYPSHSPKTVVFCLWEEIETVELTKTN